MNKKKLPKVIVQTTDGFSPAGSTGAANEPRAIPVMASGNPGFETVSQKVQGTSNVVPITPAAQRSSARAPAIAGSPATSFVSSENRERRTKALTMVNRHAAYAAAGGLIPVPLVNFAGVTVVIVRMVKVLSRHYG